MAVEWSIIDEIRLFRWVAEFKPAGIHKHFHMLCIMERMNHPDKYPVTLLQKDSIRMGKVFTTNDIWDKLSSYYNLEEMDKLEFQVLAKPPVPHDDKSESILEIRYQMARQRDFELTWDEYGELILDNARDGVQEDEEAERLQTREGQENSSTDNSQKDQFLQSNPNDMEANELVLNSVRTRRSARLRNSSRTNRDSDDLSSDEGVDKDYSSNDNPNNDDDNSNKRKRLEKTAEEVANEVTGPVALKTNNEVVKETANGTTHAITNETSNATANEMGKDTAADTTVYGKTNAPTSEPTNEIVEKIDEIKKSDTKDAVGKEGEFDEPEHGKLEVLGYEERTISEDGQEHQETHEHQEVEEDISEDVNQKPDIDEDLREKEELRKGEEIQKEEEITKEASQERQNENREEEPEATLDRNHEDALDGNGKEALYANQEEELEEDNSVSDDNEEMKREGNDEEDTMQSASGDQPLAKRTRHSSIATPALTETSPKRKKRTPEQSVPATGSTRTATRVSSRLRNRK